MAREFNKEPTTTWAPALKSSLQNRTLRKHLQEFGGTRSPPNEKSWLERFEYKAKSLEKYDNKSEDFISEKPDKGEGKYEKKMNIKVPNGESMDRGEDRWMKDREGR